MEVINYYTLDQAREILKKEEQEKRERYLRNEARKKRIVLYFLKQKLLGLLCILISTGSSIIMQDCTIMALMVPLGIGLLITRERVI